MRAMVYVRFSSEKEAELYLPDFRKKMLKYCEEKKYDVLVFLNLIGTTVPAIKRGEEKIMELARKDMIDLLVVPNLCTLSASMAEAARMIRNLKQYRVNVECVRYDLAEYTLNRILENENIELIIPGASEPSVRTLRATIPENESQPNFLILV